jgi:hypothetical protein
LQRVREWTFRGAVVVAVSVAIGYLVTTGVHEVATRMAATHLGMPHRRFRTFPGALPLVLAFVAISTLGHLQPAYLYGHLSGSVDTSGASPPPRARALQVVTGSLAVLALALICWLARGAVSSPFVSSVLAGCFVVALSRLAFGLAPITYFDGAVIAAHSRAMWACLYVPVLALFVLLILVPAARSAPASGVVGAALLPFLVFAALSVGLWWWFRTTQGSSGDRAPSHGLVAPARRAG